MKRRCPKCDAKIRVQRHRGFCSKTCRQAHNKNISREEQLAIEASNRSWTFDEAAMKAGHPIFRVSHERWLTLTP
jgi:endogenous inhibitor of DNA gyrase (YacG/DUF329 family)